MEEMHQKPVASDSLRKLERALRAIALTHSPEPEIQTELVDIEEEIGAVHDRIEEIRSVLADECSNLTVIPAIEGHGELQERLNNVMKRIEKHEDIQFEMTEAIEAISNAKKELATDFAEFITASCREK